MAGYTKRNLAHDVEDQAPKFGYSPNLEFRMAAKPLETEQSALSLLRAAEATLVQWQACRSLSR